MKKIKAIGFALAIMLIAVLAFGTANAEVYTVKKGDCLSKIGKKYDVSWKVLARENRLKNPNLIRPNQKINIPEIFEWEHANANPFKGTLDNALILLGYSNEIADLLKAEVADDRFETGSIVSGDKIAVMTFGKNIVKKNVISRIKKDLAVKIYAVTVQDKKYQLIYPLVCGNWSRIDILIPKAPETPKAPEVIPPEEKVPEIIPPKELIEAPVPPKTVESSYYEIPCPECKDLEVMAGVSTWVNSPGKNESTKGSNYWAEALYWENLEKDCSSEYWGGIGAIGSYYNYKADHLPSKGTGWRAAGEIGLKRFYTGGIDENGIEKERSWQLKARFGWEESKWENSATNKKIKQRGPVYGEYGEYIHELIDEKLYLVIQQELWLGFNQKISGPKEWNLSPQSRTYFASFLGIDWKFAKNLTLRIGPGYNWQGWDEQHVFAPQAQIMWDIPNQGGRLAAGFYGNIYSHLGPTLGILGRYENPYLLKKEYGKYRISQWKYTGVGIDNRSSIENNKEKGGEKKEVVLQEEKKESPII